MHVHVPQLVKARYLANNPGEKVVLLALAKTAYKNRQPQKKKDHRNKAIKRTPDEGGVRAME